MIKIYAFLFFLFFSATVQSQVILSLKDDKMYRDSIVQATKHAKSDSIKSLYSFRLSKIFLQEKDLKSAQYYLAQGNRYKTKSSFLRDASLYYNACDLIEKGDFKASEKALFEVNTQLKKYRNKEAYRLRALALQDYGRLQQSKNNENAYMKLLVNEAIPLAKKSGDFELISSLNTQVALIFMNNDEREKAAEYLDEAQRYIENTNKKSATLAQSKIETYIINAENLVELQHFYDAEKILDKAFLTLKDYPKSQLNDSYYYAEGLYFAKQNKHIEARISFQKGIKSAQNHGDVASVNKLKFAEYEVLFKIKNFDKAKGNLEYLVENTPLIVDKKNYYKELSKVYNATKDFSKAYFYSNKYNVINDSLKNVNLKNEIVELEAKYKKAESDRKIGLLQSENEKAVLQVNNNRLNMMLFAVLSCVLFLTVLFLWSWNNYQKKISFQKEVNHKQELEALENEQKLSISNALIEGEEIERKRIARDLHDGLGSMLSGLKIHLNLANRKNQEMDPNINGMLNDSIKELRNISQNLMPESLVKLGLEHALRDLCASHSNQETAIEFQYLVKKSNVPKHYKIVIFRIIQELLNNALKYAKASQILVSCSQNKDVFFITVEDNGIGFNVQHAEKREGMGLRNIKNRVAFLHGKLEIDSVQDKGTSTYIELKI